MLITLPPGTAPISDGSLVAGSGSGWQRSAQPAMRHFRPDCECVDGKGADIPVELDYHNDRRGRHLSTRMVGMRALLPLANATAIHAHWGYANALLAQARTNVRIARVLAILSTCAAADDVLRELRRSKHCTGMRPNAWAQATGSDRI